jgi:hypothetical protein
MPRPLRLWGNTLSRSRLPLLVRVLVPVGLLSSVLAPAASAHATDAPDQRHNVPRPHRTGVAAPATTSTSVIDVVVPLHLSAAARERVAQLAHGQASAYQRRAQLQALAPARSQTTQVTAWAGEHGFTVTSSTPWSVGLRGRADALAVAFGTSLRPAQLDGKGFVVPRHTPVVPTALAGSIDPVVGLDTRPLFSGHAVYGGGDVQVLNSTPVRGVGSGTGATVATVNLSGWHPEDLHTYRAAAFGSTFADNAPAPTSVTVSGGHAAATVLEDDYGMETEVALDAEAIAGVAPAAKQRMYFGGNSSAGYLAILNQMAADLQDTDTTNDFQTASTSWGTCELGLPTSDLQQMSYAITLISAHATFFAASGDDGAFDCGDGATPAVDFPAAAQDTVAVGGTTVTGTAPSYSSTGWSGSGGGCSARVTAPARQAVAGNPCSGRAVPDIATLADPNSGFWIYDKVDEWLPIGGTSLAAPVSAAGLAAAQMDAGMPTLTTPFLTTAYANPGAFTDVTSGDNGLYRAATGYDLVTGLGSPRWTAFEDAINGVTGEPTPTGYNEPLLAVDPTYDPSSALIETPLPFGGVVNGFAPNGEPVTGYAISGAAPTSCSSTTSQPPAEAALPGGEGEHLLWLSVATSNPDVPCINTQRPVVVDSAFPVAPKPVATYVGTTAPAYRFGWAAATDSAPSSGILFYFGIVHDITKDADVAMFFTTGRAFPYAGDPALKVIAGHRYAVRVVAVDGAFNFAEKQTAFLPPYDDSKATLSRHLSNGTYVSDWARTKASPDYLGSHVRSNRKGAAFALQFTGRSLVAGVIKGRSGGYADIYVDGVKRARVSLYASSTRYRQALRLAGFTKSGTHRVVVKVVGAHASGSVGNDVYLDSLTVTS